MTVPDHSIKDRVVRIHFEKNSGDEITDDLLEPFGTAVAQNNTTAQAHGSSPLSPSQEKTRAALLVLLDSPQDRDALDALWEENRDAIEAEMNRHLRTSSDSFLQERLRTALASQAKFFCDEVDEPQAWVVRCANLEARRAALQLIR